MSLPEAFPCDSTCSLLFDIPCSHCTCNTALSFTQSCVLFGLSRFWACCKPFSLPHGDWESLCSVNTPHICSLISLCGAGSWGLLPSPQVVEFIWFLFVLTFLEGPHWIICKWKHHFIGWIVLIGMKAEILCDLQIKIVKNNSEHWLNPYNVLGTV